MKIPLSKPWITEEDIKAVDEVLNSLNERQRKSVEYLKKNKIISRQKYASLFGCSARMAYNDLQERVSKNILWRKGKGKYTYYELSYSLLKILYHPENPLVETPFL